MTRHPTPPALALFFVVAGPAAVGDDVRFGEAIPVATSHPGAWMDGAPSRAAATSREGKMFGYALDVPRGAYRLELGFSELEVGRPGRRTFAVLANGAPLLKSIDLFAEAGRVPSFVRRTFDVDVEDAGLKLELFARSHRAALSWISLEGEGVSRFIDCGGDEDVPAATESPLGEVVLAKFGSRAFLDIRPQWRTIESSPLGKGFEEERPTILGFVVDGQKVSLPFNQAGGDTIEFDEVRETRTMTSVTYHVRTGDVDGSIALTAPFHPGDPTLSALPFFHLRFRVEAIDGDPPDELRAAIFLPVYEATGRKVTPKAKDFRGLVMTRAFEAGGTERGLFLGRPGGDGKGVLGSHLRIGDYGAWVSVPIKLDAAGAGEVDLLYVQYATDPVLLVDGAPHRFPYATRHASIEELAKHAAAQLDRALDATRVVDSLASEAVLPDGVADLMIAAFSSVSMNLYVTEGERGARWSSLVDGARPHHSPIATERFVAPFYAWFAPSMLDERLDHWARTLAAGDGVLAADLGWTNHVGTKFGMRGGTHDHPVEASADYLTLLHQRWVRSGDDAVVLSRASIVDGRVAVILRSDRDGDGVPDEGTASAIHDAAPATQYARARTATAMKCAAALLAGAEMLRRTGHQARADEAVAAASTIRETLDRVAWRGDHYAVSLDPDGTPLVDPRPNRAEHDLVDHANELRAGRAAASPHAIVGLLEALGTGLELPFDEARLRSDLLVGAARSETRFGSAYSEREVRGRVSLDLFRDAAACRLGEDAFARTARYAALQRTRARAKDLREWGGFCDSPYDRSLAYSPRGAAVFALIDAAAGLTVDRRRGTMRLRPVRLPLRVPLASFADWTALRVPWFEVTRGPDGKPTATITEPDRLDGLALTIDLTRVGGSVTTSEP